MGEWIERKLDPDIAKLMDLGGEVAPELWDAAVRAQWARIEEVRDSALAHHRPGVDFIRDPEGAERLRYESHFLVIAIRRLLWAREICFELTGDERLAEAQRAFDDASPNVKEFRDWLEHLHDYQLGRGKLQRPGGMVGQRPGLEPVVRPGPPKRVVLRFDRYELDLGDAANAAIKLAEITEQVWADQVAAGMRDWLGSAPTVE